MKIGRRLKTFIFSSFLSFGWVRACMHKWFSSAPHIFQTLERINTQLGENCSIFMICWQQCRGACYQLHSWRYLVNLHSISHSVVKINLGKLQGVGLSLKTFWLQLFLTEFSPIIISSYFYYMISRLILNFIAEPCCWSWRPQRRPASCFYQKQRLLNYFIQSKCLWPF